MDQLSKGTILAGPEVLPVYCCTSITPLSSVSAILGLIGCLSEKYTKICMSTAEDLSRGSRTILSHADERFILRVC